MCAACAEVEATGYVIAVELDDSSLENSVSVLCWQLRFFSTEYMQGLQPLASMGMSRTHTKVRPPHRPSRELVEHRLGSPKCGGAPSTRVCDSPRKSIKK